MVGKGVLEEGTPGLDHPKEGKNKVLGKDLGGKNWIKKKK